MKNEIRIVDRGRGMQLSSCRITVQDVLPYLLDGWTYEQIKTAMPILTAEEYGAIKHYVAAHREEVMEADRRIRERNAQARNPTWVEDILRGAREQRHDLLKARLEERNGANHTG